VPETDRLRVLLAYRDHFSFVPGGIERHVHEVAAGLRDRFAIEVVASSRSRRSIVSNEEGYRLNLVAEYGRVAGAPLAPGVWAALRGPTDLIHLHCPSPTDELAFASGPRAAAVATFHADVHRAPLLTPVYRRLLLRTLRNCKRVIVSTDRLIDNSPVLTELARTHPDIFEVIPFGVDVERFSPRPTEAADRLRSRWPQGPVALFVGRFRHYKGLPELVRAVARTDQVLVMAGDGPLRDEVVALGSSLLGPRFVFLGSVRDEDLPDVYRAADIACMPSTSAAEVFGISILEAMASGLPAITTELGTATSRNNVDGSTGYVVPPGDVTALAGALSKLGDPETRSVLGAAARERVAEHFSVGRMLSRLERTYRDAVES
jgi:glycosyltransferase involved in cell wall biosynthesis